MGLHSPSHFQEGSLSGTLAFQTSEIEQPCVEPTQGIPVQIRGAFFLQIENAVRMC